MARVKTKAYLLLTVLLFSLFTSFSFLPISAHEQSSSLIVPIAENPITIDGNISENREWNDARKISFKSSNQEDVVLYLKYEPAKRTLNGAFVMPDSSPDFDTLDLYFDIAHSGGNAPQLDHKSIQFARLMKYDYSIAYFIGKDWYDFPYRPISNSTASVLALPETEPISKIDFKMVNEPAMWFGEFKILFRDEPAIYGFLIRQIDRPSDRAAFYPTTGIIASPNTWTDIKFEKILNCGDEGDNNKDLTRLSSPIEFRPGVSSIDFEGSGQNGLQLSNHIPGLTFTGATVVDGALIDNSFNINKPAYKSEFTAIRGNGTTRIDFSPGSNITQVGTFISPSSIGFNRNAQELKDFYLTALDSEGRRIGILCTSILTGTNNSVDVQNVKPVFLGITSERPISEIMIVSQGGSAFFLDDLVFFEESTKIPYSITTNIPIEEENLVILSVDNKQHDSMYLPHTFYKDVGKSVKVEVINSSKDNTAGFWYEFIGYGNGFSNEDGMIASDQKYNSYELQFKKYYYLEVKMPPNFVPNTYTSGTGWYESNSKAELNVESVIFVIWPIPWVHDFKGWTGNLENSNPYNQVEMDSPKEVLANFAPNNYALTAFIGLIITIITLSFRAMRDKTWKRISSLISRPSRPSDHR